MQTKPVVVLALVCIVSAAQAKTVTDPAGLQPWLKAHLRKEYRDSPDHKALRYDYMPVDLNGDGRREVLVYVAGGSRNCGTGGCGLTVLQSTGSNWRVVSETSIGWSPIRILRTSSRGWRDLGVTVAGGGVTKPYEARLRFDGKTYPANPSVPPATRLIAGTPGTVAIETATEPLF